MDPNNIIFKASNGSVSFIFVESEISQREDVLVCSIVMTSSIPQHPLPADLIRPKINNKTFLKSPKHFKAHTKFNSIDIHMHIKSQYSQTGTGAGPSDDRTDDT